MMKTTLFWMILIGGGATSLASDCPQLLAKLGLPAKLKAGGKPRAAKWGEVEKVVTRAREGLSGKSCGVTFGELFAPKQRDVFFPLIGNVLRTAPENSLEGVGVYNQDGERLGEFANRVVFEKRGEYNYTDYYFQFRDGRGELQSSGNRLLVDISTGKPFFFVKWDEIENRIAIDGR